MPRVGFNMNDQDLKELKLSVLMILNLRKLDGSGRTAWSNHSIAALVRRGLVYRDSEDPYREGWALTERGRDVLEFIRQQGTRTGALPLGVKHR